MSGDYLQISELPEGAWTELFKGHPVDVVSGVMVRDVQPDRVFLDEITDDPLANREDAATFLRHGNRDARWIACSNAIDTFTRRCSAMVVQSLADGEQEVDLERYDTFVFYCDTFSVTLIIRPAYCYMCLCTPGAADMSKAVNAMGSPDNPPLLFFDVVHVRLADDKDSQLYLQMLSATNPTHLNPSVTATYDWRKTARISIELDRVFPGPLFLTREIVPTTRFAEARKICVKCGDDLLKFHVSDAVYDVECSYVKSLARDAERRGREYIHNYPDRDAVERAIYTLTSLRTVNLIETRDYHHLVTFLDQTVPAYFYSKLLRLEQVSCILFMEMLDAVSFYARATGGDFKPYTHLYELLSRELAAPPPTLTDDDHLDEHRAKVRELMGAEASEMEVDAMVTAPARVCDPYYAEVTALLYMCILRLTEKFSPAEMDEWIAVNVDLVDAIYAVFSFRYATFVKLRDSNTSLMAATYFNEFIRTIYGEK